MSEVINHEDGRVELKSLDDIKTSPLYNDDLAPVPVLSRGDVVIEEGKYVAKPGRGQFLKRGLFNSPK